MNFHIVISLLGPICLLALGLILKFSNNPGLGSSKKYWPYIVIIGLILLALKIWKLFL
ncbi:hypothetical protein SAMN04488023_13421 [Pedobacter rhizosphaerae]|uniref:DUF5668 domain-containing protein n=1 Tax=Pedobacter rhizosphaerae TaxID=390241 RepID=A0A1H9UUZ8_9SPHI|nr:hypothetical protein SAMN04488023_13421 [Pedobacter rhizosphaerae]